MGLTLSGDSFLTISTIPLAPSMIFMIYSLFSFLSLNQSKELISNSAVGAEIGAENRTCHLIVIVSDDHDDGE